MSQEYIFAVSRCYPLHWVKPREKKETWYQVSAILLIMLAYKKKEVRIYFMVAYLSFPFPWKSNDCCYEQTTILLFLLLPSLAHAQYNNLCLLLLFQANNGQFCFALIVLFLPYFKGLKFRVLDHFCGSLCLSKSQISKKWTFWNRLSIQPTWLVFFFQISVGSDSDLNENGKDLYQQSVQESESNICEEILKDVDNILNEFPDVSECNFQADTSHFDFNCNPITSLFF